MTTVGMFNSRFSGHWFSAAALALWTDRATLQAWLDVEVALARAQAELGLIPPAAAGTIALHARAELFDLDQVAIGIQRTLHPFVPVLRAFEALCGEEAAGWIHWGATTQNIFDTGCALQARASQALLRRGLDRAVDAAGRLAAAHRDTLQSGRTHGQHALPITFGFRVAAWREELRRHAARIEAATADAFVARTGGAVGTFAAMGEKGRAVQARVAALLGLGAAAIPVRSAWDGMAAYLDALGLLAATIEKIAREIVFLQRTEVAEVEERFEHGKVGSSTMAQKRNPQHAQNVATLARLLRARAPLAGEAMLRMDDGDAIGGNLGDALVPEMAILAVSAVEGLAVLLEGLVVHPDAMRRNLGLTGGAILSEAVMMTLAHAIGRHHAHDVLYAAAMRAADGSVSFEEALRSHPAVAAHAGSLDVAALLDPANYVGAAAACVDDELRHDARGER
jgi:adenylosuccinate lyase/3-carboxy-cis,cis-muconate cycloisomerase